MTERGLVAPCRSRSILVKQCSGHAGAPTMRWCGPAGHDWQARMRAITEMQPDISKWFDRDMWTRAINDAGYAVTRR
ncbi:hypothetical protein ACH4FX_41365 [Streptomyces sp. NPDC018019]|uniref:hypothetical protein n=1 Tax=Streptomyces sp. NPDC018019 TaxID=3365030 RepID=UPI00378B7F6A